MCTNTIPINDSKEASSCFCSVDLLRTSVTPNTCVHESCSSFSRCASSDLNSGNRNAFVVKAQCEPKGLGVNTAESVKVVDAIRRIEDVLAKQDGLPVSLLLVLAAGAL